jgi:CubicO group peptidase (beta-lactamase class C family)
MLTPADLPRTTPEAQGIASTAILAFVEAVERQIHDLHSVMLLRHGSVVAEGWWSPYGREHPHMLFSVSKSFTSAAVGLALAEGRFSIDDPVLSFFPDETPADVSEFLAALRVRHLLTMSTGHAVDTWATMLDRPDGNWIKGFLDVPVRYAPGSHFLYNTGATYMLAAIVQKTTGMKLVDYLEPRLFAPLGITNASWEESPQGIAAGGVGLSLKTEDIARFGQLYLQKGAWQGRQLLPEAWIAEATRVQMANGEDPESDWAQGYGYQFWRCRHNAYRGDGVFGQYCIVMPEQDAVLAITGGIDVLDARQPLNLVWDILLPAMHPAPLPDNAAAQEKLANKLSGLTLRPVEGEASSPIMAAISGQTYAVDANGLGIETIRLNFSAAGCTVTFKTAAGEETIPCGYGAWQRGQTRLFNEAASLDPIPAAASGAWTAEDNFTMVVRLYETPFAHQLVFHVLGDEMMVEVGGSISLRASETLLLTARRLESLRG